MAEGKINEECDMISHGPAARKIPITYFTHLATSPVFQVNPSGTELLLTRGKDLVCTLGPFVDRDHFLFSFQGRIMAILQFVLTPD